MISPSLNLTDDNLNLFSAYHTITAQNAKIAIPIKSNNLDTAIRNKNSVPSGNALQSTAGTEPLPVKSIVANHHTSQNASMMHDAHNGTRNIILLRRARNADNS
ncbi:MAG: hypothetical protein CO042_01105 [Parcubacteria group bacterium CG_4_9_14_0_2_um_filter_41_8]|nr:MAG: hypothetical protein COY02_01095 [Parcubacteria group bacterium CG_4_10_14_0_2_um_filter_41_6]PJC40934.1 MAG: hypothetical protein CO042_01105 [Parcubacteria group bacterium CG_4_9_14_0_2_um_filter_41_8]